MSKGKVGKIGVILGKMMTEQDINGTHGCDKVCVGEDNAFGSTSASTGVHDACGSFGRRSTVLDEVVWDCFSLLLDLVNVENLYVLANGVELVDEFGAFVAIVDDILDGRGIGEDVEKGAEEVGVGEETDTFGFVEGVGKAFLA